MGSPFRNPPYFPRNDTPRGADVIVISPQDLPLQQLLDAPNSKKHRVSTDAPTNPTNALTNTPSSLFYKTRLCAKFKSGHCPNGSKCNFAHGSNDLHQPPPNWQDIVNSEDGNKNEPQRTHKNNKFCRKFYNGEVCPYGEKCTFLHVERGAAQEGSAVAKEATDSASIVVVDGSGSGLNQKQAFWKTRMCTKWETTGNCPFGEACNYAHGPAVTELQKFSGNTELPNGNTGAAPTTPAPDAQNLVSASAAESTTIRQIVNKKLFAKWAPGKRISGVYGDWIDDTIIRWPGNSSN